MDPVYVVINEGESRRVHGPPQAIPSLPQTPSDVPHTAALVLKNHKGPVKQNKRSNRKTGQ
jgi:hypothetical protein